VTVFRGIIGSMLWKKSNKLDPASEKEPVKFFIQNQLGAFIPILAFLPIIFLIFLNKDMGKTQQGVAGAVGVVVALAAVALGIDCYPASVEKYTADMQAVIQLLGEDKVYWADGGEVFHVCGDVSDLSGSAVTAGTTAEAVAEGKPRLTLKLGSELEACGRAVPNNLNRHESQPADVRLVDPRVARHRGHPGQAHQREQCRIRLQDRPGRRCRRGCGDPRAELRVRVEIHQVLRHQRRLRHRGPRGDGHDHRRVPDFMTRPACMSETRR
jgi:hypothetical protein